MIVLFRQQLVFAALLFLGVVQGSPAMAQVPLLPVYGDGVAAYSLRDYDRAHEIFTAHAEIGVADAQYRLGVMRERGHGVPADAGLAADWYAAAAAQGHAKAAWSLANAFATGQGRPKDAERALHWFTVAAEAGDPFAQYHLAGLYLAGQGVEKDPVKALNLLTSAAEGFSQPARQAQAAALRDQLATALDQ